MSTDDPSFEKISEARGDPYALTDPSVAKVKKLDKNLTDRHLSTDGMI